MKISIGSGIHHFLFGQTEQQVINSQGTPNKKFADEHGDIFLLFNSLETTLKFEKENDFKLSWIETSNMKATLPEFSPWGVSQVEIITKLTQILGELPEIEDYGDYQSMTFNNSWLELQFRYEKLKQINFGVLYNDKSEPLWPENIS